MGCSGSANKSAASRAARTPSLAALQRALQRTLPTASLEVVSLPACASLKLALIGADFPTGPLPPEVMRAVLARPAYWSLCWGSGLALAQFLLSEPQWVAGKSVLDLGSGSGVAAIAAAKAGAERVLACDRDPDARLATKVNAALNDVAVEVLRTLPEHVDILLMADVLYDRENLALLETAQRHATSILVADSRVTTLPTADYRAVARIPALTQPNLGEFDEFDTAYLFHWQRS